MTRSLSPERALRRARLLLALFSARHVVGVALVAALVYHGFMGEDRRLGWFLLPALVIYAGYAGWIVRRLALQVRRARVRVERSEG